MLTPPGDDWFPFSSCQAPLPAMAPPSMFASTPLMIELSIVTWPSSVPVLTRLPLICLMDAFSVLPPLLTVAFLLRRITTKYPDSLVSAITTQFLQSCCERLQKQGKTNWLLIWENASWHKSQAVRTWIREHNQQVKQMGKGVRILPFLLPTQSPWLNPIEPKWVHGKQNVVETNGVLTAKQLAERVCAEYSSKLKRVGLGRKGLLSVSFTLGHDFGGRLGGPIEGMRVLVPFENKGHQTLSQMIQIGKVADAEPFALENAEPLLHLIHKGGNAPAESGRRSGGEPPAKPEFASLYGRSDCQGPSGCESRRLESPDGAG